MIREAIRFVEYLVSVRNSIATAVDVSLATILAYTLHRSRTGIKRTDTMVIVLIMYAVNTGVLTRYPLDSAAFSLRSYTDVKTCGILPRAVSLTSPASYS